MDQGDEDAIEMLVDWAADGLGLHEGGILRAVWSTWSVEGGIPWRLGF